MKTTPANAAFRRTDRVTAFDRTQPKPGEPCRGGETRAVQAALRAIRSAPFASTAPGARAPRADAPFICG